MSQSDKKFSSDVARYVTTERGNHVSHDCKIDVPDAIVVAGRSIIKPGCVLHSEITSSKVQVCIGRYCLINERCVLRPPYGRSMTLCDFVSVGAGSVVEAHRVGNHVRIGRRVKIGRMAVLHDCCHVMDDAVVPPHAVVPSYAIVAGTPARVIADLPECTSKIRQGEAREYYATFSAVQK